MSVRETRRESPGAAHKRIKGSGLGFGVFVRLAMRFELRELLRSQDSLSLFHERFLARLGATGLVMFGHGCVHFRLLLGGEVQFCHGYLAGRLFFVSDLLCAASMIAREHGACRKESRYS